MSHSQPIHLRPTATLAERVLLPGDPGRALALAQLLLSEPLMFNHHRGLWGYTGAAADGQPLTIQSTGMGGPSAAIVLHELISLGTMRAIRVGTCGALDATLGLGDLVVAREAIAADGTSAALGARARTHAHPALTDRLTRVLGRDANLDREDGLRDDGGVSGVGDERGIGDESGIIATATRPTHHDATIVSTDLFYEPDTERNRRWSADGAIAVEMEASALFAVGAAAGIEVACVLTVTDTFDAEGARARIDDGALVEAVETMGRTAAAALAV